MAQMNFNAQNVPTEFGFDVLPAGWYNVQIVDSEMKPTNSGDGSYLALEMAVIDGQYVERRVFTNLNLNNPNPKAVEFAYKQMSAICHATGVLVVQDSSQLHGIPFKVKVKVKTGEQKADGGKYDDRNEPTAYKHISAVTVYDQPPSSPQFAAVPQFGSPPPQFGSPPPQFAAPSAQWQQPPAQPWTPPAAQEWAQTTVPQQAPPQAQPNQAPPAGPPEPPHATQSANPPWSQPQ